MNGRDRARAVADAVLYEGFMLFPYRKSALKNAMPFQFGVLMPLGYADRSEPSSLRSEVVLVERGDARVNILLRFLQSAVDPLEREVALEFAPAAGRVEHPFSSGGLNGTIAVQATRGDGGVTALAIEVHNRTRTLPEADRNEALEAALISAHVLLYADDAKFASLLDPPEIAAEAAARCVNERVFPVLAGEPGDGGRTSDAILVSPIVLYDFPRLAEASTTHTFDATEIDELLMLSVASLSDEEKVEARAAHPYVRELVERAEALDADTQALLHGELTGGTGEPGDETVTIGNRLVRRGSHVRVHPRGRADVWDDLVDGMDGRVCAVHTDFEGKRYVGVVFDGDPASDVHEWYGRSFFYGPEEIEPIS